MKTRLQHLSLFFLLAVVLFSNACVREGKDPPLPSATGKLSELTVVMDTSLWIGDLGEQVRTVYGANFPFVEPATPLFDLKYISPGNFLAQAENLRQRNCLVLLQKYSNKPEEQELAKAIESRLTLSQLKLWRENTAFSVDKLWADPQRVVLIMAREEEQLVTLWKDNFPTLYQRIRENEGSLLESILYKNGIDNTARELIQNGLGVEVVWPKGITLLSKTDSVLWFRHNFNDGSKAWILIRKAEKREWERCEKEAIPTFLGILKRSPGPEGKGDEQFQVLEKTPFSAFIRYKKVVPAYEWRGTWSRKQRSGPFVALFPDFLPDAPIFFAGFLESGGPRQREKLLQLQHLLTKMRIEAKP
jgi:Domain of unknown function (DUF4837)